MTKTTHQTRLKKLRLRSWRRGTKEMDLILGHFADTVISSLTPAELDAHEALMAENDQDLYQWVTGQVPTPDPFGPLIADVAQMFQK